MKWHEDRLRNPPVIHNVDRGGRKGRVACRIKALVAVERHDAVAEDLYRGSAVDLIHDHERGTVRLGRKLDRPPERAARDLESDASSPWHGQEASQPVPEFGSLVKCRWEHFTVGAVRTRHPIGHRAGRSLRYGHGRAGDVRWRPEATEDVADFPEQEALAGGRWPTDCHVVPHLEQPQHFDGVGRGWRASHGSGFVLQKCR